LLKGATAEAKNVFDKMGVPFSLKDHIALVDIRLQALPEAKETMDDFKYQLVLQLPGHTQEDFDLVVSLEESLTGAVEGTPHQVDGHDFGSGTGNIFLDTNDPIAAFELSQKVVNLTEYPMLKVAYRPFEGDDYTLIWPKESKEPFNLM